MQKNTTRKAFLLSLASMLLCLSMLVGSTFAWFTDTVTSGVNRIVAGNLDIEVFHTSRVQTTEEKIDAQTDLFKDVTLWEPGAVSYENFTIKNLGTLAAKYVFSLNVASANKIDGHDLTEVIKVVVVDGGFTGTREDAAALTGYTSLADFQKNGVLAANNGTHTYGVVLYWAPTANDNDYNINNGKVSSDGQPLYIDFGITVIATQNTVESDSFDNQYDATAPLSIVTAPISSTVSDDIVIPEKDIVKSANIPSNIVNTIFNNLKQADAENSMVLEFVFEEKTPSGDATAVFDVSLNAIMTSKKDDNVSVQKSPVTSLSDYIDVVVQLAPGLARVEVTHSSNSMVKLDSIDDTSKTDNGYGFFYYDVTTGLLYLKVKSLSPFAVYSSDMWEDYVTEQPAGFVRDDTNLTVRISSPEALVWFAKTINEKTASYAKSSSEAYTVIIVGTIDLGAHYWTPITEGFTAYDRQNGQLCGTIITGEDGVIKNLKVKNTTGDAAFFNYKKSKGTISNLVFENADIVTTKSRGAVLFARAGCGSDASINVDNVTFKNCNVTAWYYAGTVLALSDGSGHTVNIRNCTIDNCNVAVTITGYPGYDNTGCALVGLYQKNDKLNCEGTKLSSPGAYACYYTDFVQEFTDTTPVDGWYYISTSGIPD